MAVRESCHSQPDEKRRNDAAPRHTCISLAQPRNNEHSCYFRKSIQLGHKAVAIEVEDQKLSTAHFAM